MGKFKIYPLDLGTLVRGSERVGHHWNPGVPYTYPILAWYLTDGENKYLVDVGGPEPFADKMPYTRTEDQKIENALAKLGVRCEEITKIFITHLHWDHTYNLELFPNAKLYVQRKELEYAIRPIPTHEPTYYHIGKLVQFKYVELQGDEQVCEGISVLLTPGHTPGSQSILVDTDDGVFAIIGDLTNLDELWTAEPKIASGVLLDLPASYDSFTKVARNADYVLTGHDKKYLEYACFPNGQFPRRETRDF